MFDGVLGWGGSFCPGRVDMGHAYLSNEYPGACLPVRVETESIIGCSHVQDEE